MNIAMFNINNINRRLSNLPNWLDAAKPDVACLQELKTEDRQFPEIGRRNAGYSAVWQDERTWNGLAILAGNTTSVLTCRSLAGDATDKQSRYIDV